MYSRSSIHLIGKLSWVYSYFSTTHIGRCIECENFAFQTKKDFDLKESSVNEIREAQSKFINRRRLNIII